jgi:plastocyanin
VSAAGNKKTRDKNQTSFRETMILLAGMCAFAAAMSTITIPIGADSIPSTIIVQPGDAITFINIDFSAVHRLSAPFLPGFNTQDLYPEQFRANTPQLSKFTYVIPLNTTPGTYQYGCGLCFESVLWLDFVF